MEWIISGNLNIYDYRRAFAELPYVDWRQIANYQVGDIIYVYSTKPVQAVEYVCEVIQVDIEPENLIDDTSYWIDSNNEINEVGDYLYSRLKVVSKIPSNLITLKDLFNHGMKGNIQGPRKLIDTNGDELEWGTYIKETYSNFKKSISNRILFCNIAYMKNYDGDTSHDTPINGGKYVKVTQDAFEKYNFQLNEDGFVKGFVETKYSGGYDSLDKKPKTIHIENIDFNYKKEEEIDGVTVIFCAKSPNLKKTVIVGWYKNATVFRNRKFINNRTFNIQAKNEDTFLLDEKERLFEIPRATLNSERIGFGQANVWFAKKKQEQEIVLSVFEYIKKNEKESVLANSTIWERFNQIAFSNPQFRNNFNESISLDRSYYDLTWNNGKLHLVLRYSEKNKSIEIYINEDKQLFKLISSNIDKFDDELRNNIEIYQPAIDKNLKHRKIIFHYEHEYKEIHYINWLIDTSLKIKKVLDTLILVQDKKVAIHNIHLDEGLISEIGNKKIFFCSPFQYSDTINEKPECMVTNGIISYKRNRQTALNALSHAEYKCEINNEHYTFIRKNSEIPYTEPHHLIPMAFQDEFDYSLDIEENIVSLCSSCHNEIHYGKNAKQLIMKLYNERKKVLEKKKIHITIEKLLSYYHI